MAWSHADAARSNLVVRAHARTIPCGTPRAAVAVNVPQSPFPQIQPRYPMCYSILLTPFPIGSTAVKGPISDATTDRSEMTRICETVPTPPRAAADRPRAPGYMVWMCKIDN